MHILITANDFFPDPGSGGAGRYIHETGKRLVEQGHKVSVITRNRNALASTEQVSGINVYRFELVNKTGFFYSEIRNYIIGQIGINSIDLLNFQDPFSSWVADQVVPDTIPRVYTFHSPWAEEYTAGITTDDRQSLWSELNAKIRDVIERSAIKNSAVVVTLSEYMRRKVTEHHSQMTETEVIPGGVDIDRFSPKTSDRIHSTDNKFNLLTIRRLVPRMGVETLLKSLSEILDNGITNIHLYIGGDGPLREELEDRAAELGIGSSVTFLGFIPEDQLSQVYREMDLFVLPTNTLEGFGLVTLEAMSSGTPVLATSAGATPEILSPLESSNLFPAPLLSDTTDSGTLAEKIREWTLLSEEDLNLASQKCREYVVEQYSWDETVNELETLFTRIT